MKLPTILNVEGPVVIFGGGPVGLRKVEYLLKFTDDITVVSDEFVEMPTSVRKVEARLENENIGQHIPDDTSLVIAALSDQKLNRHIAEYCKERKIPVNVVDDPECCTILLPALSKSEDLSISISTSGRSPFLARKIREEVDSWIELKGNWLTVMASIRNEVDGIEERNRLFEIVYKDVEITTMVEKGDFDGAIRKAREVIDVHR
jgi:siroheme synthase-like protein